MSTKLLFVGSVIVLVLISVISFAEVPQANDPVPGAALSKNPAIVKDEILIPMENGTEMEWRHIILKGNNTQIGMALGEIAQKDYGLTSLKKYADPVYGTARQEDPP
jgi:hypothetical protein